MKNVVSCRFVGLLLAEDERGDAFAARKIKRKLVGQARYRVRTD